MQYATQQPKFIKRALQAIDPKIIVFVLHTIRCPSARINNRNAPDNRSQKDTAAPSKQRVLARQSSYEPGRSSNEGQGNENNAPDRGSQKDSVLLSTQKVLTKQSGHAPGPSSNDAQGIKETLYKSVPKKILWFCPHKGFSPSNPATHPGKAQMKPSE